MRRCHSKFSDTPTANKGIWTYLPPNATTHDGRRAWCCTGIPWNGNKCTSGLHHAI